MNLQPVKQQEGYLIRCVRCNVWSRDLVADLDGRPFLDYYCPQCVNEVRQ